MNGDAQAADLQQMEAKAGEAAGLLRSMANESRLMVLCHLLGGEQSVGELNQHVALSQSALSQHLAKLRQDGLVSTRKEAQTVYYSLSSDKVAQVIQVLHQLYCQTTCSD